MAVADLFILSFAWIEIKRTVEKHDDKWMEKTGDFVCKLHYGIVQWCMVVSVTIIAIMSFGKGNNKRDYTMKTYESISEPNFRPAVYN